ncbi:hypothetical protein B0H14DRAFT_2580922 [Mycena olivaceomarginata]|nr:hypothetical protein B0H14DRAFT_2580922 [Mycena olivaceomarginata]
MPLDRTAARETFIEIADEVHDQLLDITDNIPLAVQLVAGIAASVGCQDTMERWNIEKTSLLSAGYDKRSNLDMSITLSLSSPHMLSSPHAMELLSLMSLLSNGISDLDLDTGLAPYGFVMPILLVHLPVVVLEEVPYWIPADHGSSFRSLWTSGHTVGTQSFGPVKRTTGGHQAYWDVPFATHTLRHELKCMLALLSVAIDFAGRDRSSSTDEHFPEELMDALDGEIPQIVVETSGDDSNCKENAHIVAGRKRKAEDFADEGAERRPRRRIVKPTRLNL